MRYHQIINEGWTTVASNLASRSVYSVDIYQNVQANQQVELWARIYTVSNKLLDECLLFSGDPVIVDFDALKVEAIEWFNYVMAKNAIQ